MTTRKGAKAAIVAAASVAAATELATIERTPDEVKAAKARRTSPRERDDNGVIVRKGKNLSGNVPFREKLYTLVGVPSQEALRAAPGQVEAIIKYMAESKCKARGGEIVQGAIDAGHLKTKIDPPVLFAYYRRLLETMGVQHIA